jgi:RNA polymerase sigma factor (sigma-70 family)
MDLGRYLRPYIYTDIRRRAPHLAPLAALSPAEMEPLADDVVQTALARVHENLHQYEPSGSFLMFALTVARNILRDWLRKKYWQLETPTSTTFTTGDDPPTPLNRPGIEDVPDPSQLLDSNAAWREMAQIVYKTIGEDLNPNQVYAFVAYHFRNLSSKEIAQQMGKTFSEVDQFRYQARQKIKQRLQEHGYSEQDLQ